MFNVRKLKLFEDFAFEPEKVLLVKLISVNLGNYRYRCFNGC